MGKQLTIEQWHLRFLEQAGWSSAVRSYIFHEINISGCKSILEVGCGTGAILQEFPDQFRSTHQIIGIDLDISRVQFARNTVPQARAVCGDAYRLPLVDNSIDIAFCHYLLLWLDHPAAALKEVLRVVKPGGWIAALAEPDHAARVDWPPPFIGLGSRQTDALEQQGIDPMMGRKLTGYFADAGIDIYKAGIMSGQWKPQLSDSDQSLEWDVLQADLQLPEGERIQLQKTDSILRTNASRVEFVPTFYAYGKKRNMDNK